MSFWSTFLRSAALFLITAVLTGCLPGSSDNVDEQKDPHYIKGRNLASSLDYKGAIDEFEKAIEDNPRSAKAHFEVGLLYGEQMKDYASAIYHLQQHLKLRPDSEYIERCKELIKTYKIELVKTEYVAPMNLGAQRQIEQLTTENTMLKKQIEMMQAQFATREVLATNPLPGVRNSSGFSPPSGVAAPANYASVHTAVAAQNGTAVAPPAAPARSRTHTVRSGDTFMSIAKEHGVKVNALQQANPGIDSRRLKVGQTINLPQS